MGHTLSIKGCIAVSFMVLKLYDFTSEQILLFSSISS